MDPFFYSILLAGVIAGASCGLLGVYIVGLRLPFVGVFVSHTAMAGAVYSYLLGLNPVLGATSISAVTAMSLAAIRPGRTRVDSNVALAILFSLMLGVTFLGIGLIQDSRTEILGLLWGSILFVRRENIIVLSTAAAVLVLFTILFNKELKALLFSRSIALATGVHETFVYAMFLALCGVILAVNLPLIGGLMIFSLISNPAAAAYQLCRGHRAIVVMSVALGVLSTAGGFFISYFLNLPTGACIVLASTLVFALSAGYRSFSGRKD